MYSGRGRAALVLQSDMPRVVLVDLPKKDLPASSHLAVRCPRVMTSVHQLFAIAAVALVPMAPKLRSLPRAARISMAGQWVDGNSDWVYPENLGDALRELADPSPEVEPLAIVQLQLAALQRGTNEDIEYMWRFVAPDGELAADHENSAGSMSKFRWKIRKEPRWKNIGRRPHAALVRMRSWSVGGVLMLDPDCLLYRVTASPFFPDAEHAESEVAFQWRLVRQRAVEGAHPAAKEALGELADCWMVHGITPDFSAWHVHDPIGAGRAPDTFKPPPGLEVHLDI